MPFSPRRKKLHLRVRLSPFAMYDSPLPIEILLLPIPFVEQHRRSHPRRGSTRAHTKRPSFVERGWLLFVGTGRGEIDVRHEVVILVRILEHVRKDETRKGGPTP